MARTGAVVFSGQDRAGPPHLFRKDLGTGAQKELLPMRAFQEATDVSPDGKVVAFTERSLRGDFDLWTLPLTGESKPSPLVRSPFDEQDARFSPDGRYVAVESGRTGVRGAVPAAAARPPIGHRAGRRLEPRRPRAFYFSTTGIWSPCPSVWLLRWAGIALVLFALKEGTSWTDFDVSRRKDVSRS
jgi:hypothetical protein